jgi:L-fuculose-phosphate aldolase
MTPDRDTAVKTIVEVCHRLYAKGFVSATDGNVSLRFGERFLTTRTSVNKGDVTADDVLEVSAAGEPVGTALRPSTELGMHLFIYRQRPDVVAVVHAHPPYATGFAAAGRGLQQCVFPEVIVGLGAVPLADYATPSTDEVARSLAPFVGEADAILLANHGLVAYGTSLWDAYYKLEKVEHACHITLVASLLGGPQPLGASDIEKLRAISQQSYGKDLAGKPACEPRSATEPAHEGDGELRDLVRRMIRGA